jgi:hypothetical protein
MDCYQDEVGVELRHLPKMDCCQDAVQPELLALAQQQYLRQLNRLQAQLVARHCFRQLLALAQLLARLNQHRVRLLIQQQALD